MSALTIKRGSTETLFKRSRKSGEREAKEAKETIHAKDAQDAADSAAWAAHRTINSDNAYTSGNFFANLPTSPLADEQFSDLLKHPGLRIERIVSTGQASPDGFWYDQTEAEWVLLLQGAAQLRFEDEDQARHLKTGDYLEIAPHRRHRVEWTAADQVTVWLAVFYAV